MFYKKNYFKKTYFFLRNKSQKIQKYCSKIIVSWKKIFKKKSYYFWFGFKSSRDGKKEKKNRKIIFLKIFFYVRFLFNFSWRFSKFRLHKTTIFLENVLKILYLSLCLIFFVSLSRIYVLKVFKNLPSLV